MKKNENINNLFNELMNELEKNRRYLDSMKKLISNSNQICKELINELSIQTKQISFEKYNHFNNSTKYSNIEGKLLEQIRKVYVDDLETISSKLDSIQNMIRNDEPINNLYKDYIDLFNHIYMSFYASIKQIRN